MDRPRSVGQRTIEASTIRYLLLWVGCAAYLQAGILVTRDQQGFRFEEAVSVSVNGKDKALNLGSDPRTVEKPGKWTLAPPAGALLMDAKLGVVTGYEEGRLQYLLPEGLPRNASGDWAAIWRSATITYKKSPSDKTPIEVATPNFVAFLPQGIPELTRCATDTRALELIGGKVKVLDTQFALIAAVVKTYPTEPPVASLQTFVEQAMRRRYESFESGAAGLDALQEALRFSQLSADIYPKQTEQARLRDLLAARKAWLDRRVAITKALAAVGDWDAMLMGDRDLERYQQAFPELSGLHRQALKASLDLHRQAGDERLKESDFASALREFRLASSRQPSDKILQQRVLMAWTDYSRRVASDNVGSRRQLSAGQREALNQALLFAKGYKEQDKRDQALKSVNEAEAIDPESLPVLLTKAEILGARGEFSLAFKTLDKYDLIAVDEERDKASNLRNEMLFRMKSSVEDMKARLQADWAAGDYDRMRDLALQGLSANGQDAELFYDAGMASLVTRNAQDGRKYLTRYVELSNTLDSDDEQRKRVRAVLAGLDNLPTAPAAGLANWMSGLRLPKDVYYCPASLAFQAHVDRVEASGKMSVTYDWVSGQLRSITSSVEQARHETKETKIAFAYDPVFPSVEAVRYDNAPSLAASNPDERYKLSVPLLSNNPYVDVMAIQRLTGKNIAIGVSGNKYFLPFAWDGIHYFRLVYDDRGRVAEARELAERTAEPGDSVLEFKWDDNSRLISIRGYQGAGNQRQPTYERTMNYQEGLLRSEDVVFQGKTAKITYKYNGSTLAGAVCDRDPSLDDRSRQVTFRQDGN